MAVRGDLRYVRDINELATSERIVYVALSGIYPCALCTKPPRHNA